MTELKDNNLEEEICNDLGKQLSKDIDADIIWTITVLSCQDKGWHLVNIDRFKDKEEETDIAEWIKRNAKGKYHQNGRHFIFEERKDSNWFILRWGEGHAITSD